ncbi:hypothetical protein ACFSKL_12845 [Belliella marina]|uniref:Uncharacterized protein n=1 Tax=Belliella marina TaxID=1644146 RepID=A0ABW4VND7_9BACT
MKRIYLYLILLFMSFGSLYGQDQELSEEQYAILNLELINGMVYENTNFAYYWSNYLNVEWLSSQEGFCGYSKDEIFKTSEFSKHMDEKTLGGLINSIKNELGPKKIEASKLKNAEVKLVSEYDSNKVRYVSPPIIEGDFAVMLDRYLWIEQMNFYKKSEGGEWEKFCHIYILLSTGTYGISLLN